MRSEESREYAPKYSMQKIVHENILKRRMTTQNSPNKSTQLIQTEARHDL